MCWKQCYIKCNRCNQLYLESGCNNRNQHRSYTNYKYNLYSERCDRNLFKYQNHHLNRKSKSNGNSSGKSDCDMFRQQCYFNRRWSYYIHLDAGLFNRKQRSGIANSNDHIYFNRSQCYRLQKHKNSNLSGESESNLNSYCKSNKHL